MCQKTAVPPLLSGLVKLILEVANIDLQSAFDNSAAVSKSQLIVCNKQANRQVYSPKRMYGSQLGEVIFSPRALYSSLKYVVNTIGSLLLW